MNKLTVNLSTMLLACMAGTVAAKPIDRIIERMDTDGDGRVSREEFNPRRESPFNRVDGNGDGVATLDEINQHIADRMAEMAERHAEMQSRMQDFFTGADADGDGMVTEGTSTNAWIVTEGGDLVTRDPGAAILNGITRLAVLEIARERGVPFIERAFSLAEARAAREAFLTSTTAFVLPVTTIDDEPVGDGSPGPLSRALRERYIAHMDAE